LLWNELHLLLDDCEYLPQGSEEQIEVKFSAVAYAQALVDLLYRPEDRKKVRVINLRRASRKEGLRLKAEELRKRRAQQREFDSSTYSTSDSSERESD
jgi:uncharacterized DUF497 family protein